MNLEEHLDKLAAQGSADQIADFFEREGIVGHTCSRTCPVARYLDRETGHGHSVYSFETFEWRTGRSRVVVHNPAPVREFIISFDKGDYPQLKAAP